MEFAVPKLFKTNLHHLVLCVAFMEKQSGKHKTVTGCQWVKCEWMSSCYWAKCFLNKGEQEKLNLLKNKIDKKPNIWEFWEIDVSPVVHLLVYYFALNCFLRCSTPQGTLQPGVGLLLGKSWFTISFLLLHPPHKSPTCFPHLAQCREITDKTNLPQNCIIRAE